MSLEQKNNIKFCIKYCFNISITLLTSDSNLDLKQHYF